MTKSILLVGVGGQGTILTSKILTAGLVKLGFDVKMSEIHGMSQRGGSVVTQIRFGEKVYAPNIGLSEADIVVAFEKIEALRYTGYLKKGGSIIMDDREIMPMSVLTGASKYPHNAVELLKEAVGDVKVIHAAETAERLGNIKSQNIVLLGSLVKVLGLEGVDWEALVADMVPPKTREMNVKAFNAGFGA